MKRYISLIAAILWMLVLPVALAEGTLRDSADPVRVLQVQVVEDELTEIDDYEVPLAYADEATLEHANRHRVLIALAGGIAVVYAAVLLREHHETRRLEREVKAGAVK